MPERASHEGAAPAVYSTYGAYRPWRHRVLGNIERVYAQVI